LIFGSALTEEGVQALEERLRTSERLSRSS